MATKTPLQNYEQSLERSLPNEDTIDSSSVKNGHLTGVTSENNSNEIVDCERVQADSLIYLSEDPFAFKRSDSARTLKEKKLATQYLHKMGINFKVSNSLGIGLGPTSNLGDPTGNEKGGVFCFGNDSFVKELLDNLPSELPVLNDADLACLDIDNHQLLTGPECIAHLNETNVVPLKTLVQKHKPRVCRKYKTYDTSQTPAEKSVELHQHDDNKGAPWSKTNDVPKRLYLNEDPFPLVSGESVETLEEKLKLSGDLVEAGVRVKWLPFDDRPSTSVEAPTIDLDAILDLEDEMKEFPEEYISQLLALKDDDLELACYNASLTFNKYCNDHSK